MDADTPDRLSRGLLRMAAILGAMLAVVGWFRYVSASLWASRFVSALVYGLEPGDLSTIAAAALTLAAVAALAGALPAVRASRIEPAVVLREGRQSP